MSLEDDKTVLNPDPEEEELLIEWANERPTVERLLTGPPVIVEGNPDDEIIHDSKRTGSRRRWGWRRRAPEAWLKEEAWLELQLRETFGEDEDLGPWHWPLTRPFGIIKEWVVRVWRLLNHG